VAGVALPVVCGSLVLSACATAYWESSTYDKFPINKGKAQRGENLFRTIAVIPGGGIVADAIGVELAKRGFVIHPPAATQAMAKGVDFRAIAEHYNPARRNPAEMARLRTLLFAKGVDAFLVVRAADFEPRPRSGRAYWQRADYVLYGTDYASVLRGDEILASNWFNIHDRPQSPSQAAAEIVNHLASSAGAL
jgi:hypothetical protein